MRLAAQVAGVLKKRDGYPRWVTASGASAGSAARAMGAGVLHAETAATRFTLSRHLPAEDLAPSELILPPADATMDEVRAMLGDAGLIPD